MLSVAHRYVRGKGWSNVELVCADMAEFALPPGTGGVCAAFSLEMVPDYQGLVRHLARSLPAEGRLSVLGLKYPESWPDWLVRMAIFINRPFAINPAYAKQRPFETMQALFSSCSYREWLWGAAYLCTGRNR